MYYVFRHTFQAVKRERDVGRVENRPSTFLPNMWSGKPLEFEFPLLRFSVPSDTKMADNHVTNTSFDLYSERLINLLQTHDVKLEAFPVVMVDSKSGDVLNLKYYIFHLLQSADVFDRKLSDITSGGRVKRLVVSDTFASSGTLMARDSYLSDLTVVHQNLKQVLDDADVTGCSYTPVEQFRLL